MALIAFRAEYQLSTDEEKNRVFYKPYAAIQDAETLPHFLADWQQVLACVRPGFTVLTDLSEYEQANGALFGTFVQAQKMLVEARVRLVAEVHPPSSTHQVSEEAVEQSAMPVHYFTDLWAADQFLNELDAQPTPITEELSDASSAAFAEQEAV